MMPVEPNGTLRTASKATTTQATVEVLGMAEVEAEAVIFSGEQVRRGCNLHSGDGVGSSTWIVRKSCPYTQWLWFNSRQHDNLLWFLSLCGNFSD